MILENLVTFIGALLKHIIGVLLLCWRRMLRAGLIAFAIGVVVTALIAVIGTGQALPSAPSLVVALLLGLGLAYGVALTVLIEELILGAIDLIRMVEGDVSAGAHIAEVVAEREVGEVGQGLRRLIGLPVSKRAPTRPGAALPPLTPARPQSAPASSTARPPASPLVEAGAVAAGAAVAGAVAMGATARRSAPAGETDTTDALDPTGEPVPAGRLPRIAWTYEHEAIRPPVAPSQAAAPAIEAALASSAPARAPGPFAPPNAIMPPTPDAPETPSEPNTPDVPEEPETLPPPKAPVVRDVPIEPLPMPEEPVEPGTPAEPVKPATPDVPKEPETPAEPEKTEESGTSALEAPYEDERLFAPAIVATPEGPAEPAERVDDVEEDGEAAPIQPAPELTESPNDAPVEAGSAVVAGGVPVPAPAPSTTPLGDEIPDTQPVAAVEARQPADTQPVTAVEARQPADTQPVAAVDASHAAGPEAPPEAPIAEPASRSDFARRTLPLSDAGATLDDPGADVLSVPRPSAPESGLWERLSNALISRAVAPSGPFAPAPPLTSADESAADEATREPGKGES